jgi:hypothetical protein
MAASGTHPCYSATIPVAAPVGPEPPSRRHSPKRRQVSRLALMGSALPSRKPLWKSPADFATCAPNFEKLGQGRRARQDLVRESESTTKCGDSGEESCGGCVSIGHPTEIRKAPGAAAAGFPLDCWFLPRSSGADGDGTAGKDGCAKFPPRPAKSPICRNGWPFWPILSETRRKTRFFPDAPDVCH